MNSKIFVLTFLSVLALLVSSFFAAAVNMEIRSVEINGHSINEADGHSDNLAVDRGETLEIEVAVKALADVNDIQIEADIYGYRYADKEENKVSDTTSTFDLSVNDTEYKTLRLEVPVKMDKDYFKLRLRVADRDGISYEKVYQLHVKGLDRDSAVQIKDYSFSPANTVQAGKAVTAMVKVKNYGDEDLDDVKVTISIPELGIRDFEYLDSIEADESETFEELLLRIPSCAEEGSYEVEITVDFDEYESTTTTTKLFVTENEACLADMPLDKDEGKTIVTVPQMQQVVKGESGSVFPITLTNTGKASKTYTLSLTGTAMWGTYRMDPGSVVVVPAESTKTVYLYVASNDNAELGEKVLMLNIQTETESKQVPLTANVVAPQKTSTSWGSLRVGLEIALIVLVVILIIVGLVIAFTKMKGNSNNEEEQTYY